MTKKSRPLNLPGSANEDQFHLSVAELLDWILKPPTFFTTFPAGYGRLSKGMSGKLKAKGMKAGMPDIMIFDRYGTVTKVVGLELKVGRNTTSAAQRTTHANLQAVNAKTYLVRNLNDVIAALDMSGIDYKRNDIRAKLQPEQVVIPKQQSLFP